MVNWSLGIGEYLPKHLILTAARIASVILVWSLGIVRNLKEHQ